MKKPQISVSASSFTLKNLPPYLPPSRLPSLPPPSRHLKASSLGGRWKDCFEKLEKNFDTLWLLLKLPIFCRNCFIHVIYLHLGVGGSVAVCVCGVKNTSASFFLNKRQQNPSGWVKRGWPSRAHRWNNTPSNDSHIFWNLPFEIGLGRLFAGTWVASVCNFAKCGRL